MTRITRGAVQRTANAFDNMIVGTKGVGFPAQAIWQEQQLILEVIIQNDPASANNVLIGNEFGQYVAVVPGQSITIPINDLNNIYAHSIGGATINWIAMV